MFYFRLASKLGKYVGEIKKDMDRTEFEDWKIVYDLEPWGTTIDDRRHGQVVNMMFRLTKLWGSTQSAPDIDALMVTKTGKFVKSIEDMMYSNVIKPWLVAEEKQQELALQGQAMLQKWSEQTGVAIT